MFSNLENEGTFQYVLLIKPEMIGHVVLVANISVLFYPPCLAHAVSWFAFVVTIFKHRQTKRQHRHMHRQHRHMQGMLDETDSLMFKENHREKTTMMDIAILSTISFCRPAGHVICGSKAKAKYENTRVTFRAKGPIQQ